MTLYHRRGARLHRLKITDVGAGMFRAKWGKITTWFEASGETQDIVDAAVVALGKKEEK